MNNYNFDNVVNNNSTRIWELIIHSDDKKLVKKNIPDSIEVSEQEWLDFIKGKHLQNDSFYNEAIISYDEYGNAVAKQYAGILDHIPDKYYINPELYEMGQAEKKLIKDEYSE